MPLRWEVATISYWFIILGYKRNTIIQLLPAIKVNSIFKLANGAIMMYIYTESNFWKLNRQSITFTKPNDEWLKKMVSTQEYSSKSELVNDLIRQARKQQVQIDWINRKLEKAENSGFTDMTKTEILKEAKSRLNG